jgi:hypothetical protein
MAMMNFIPNPSGLPVRSGQGSLRNIRASSVAAHNFRDLEPVTGASWAHFRMPEIRLPNF